MMQGHQLFIVVLVSHALLGVAFHRAHGRVVRVPRLRAPAALPWTQLATTERVRLALAELTRATIGEHSRISEHGWLGRRPYSVVRQAMAGCVRRVMSMATAINRRQLLCVAQATRLPIPSDEDLKALIQQVWTRTACQITPSSVTLRASWTRHWVGLEPLQNGGDSDEVIAVQWLRESRVVPGATSSTARHAAKGHLGVAELLYLSWQAPHPRPTAITWRARRR